MTDIFTKSKRSSIMGAIKSKGSIIEKDMRTILRKAGLPYRAHGVSLLGKPDFYSIKNKIVIFVDSCFWHGCRFHGSIPKSNKAFWLKKILSNKKRDRTVNAFYRRKGWRVVRVWEHSLKKRPDQIAVVLIESNKSGRI